MVLHACRAGSTAAVMPPHVSHFEQIMKDVWSGSQLCSSGPCCGLQAEIVSPAANAGSTAAVMRRLSHLGQIVEELAALGVTGLGTVDNTRLQGEVACTMTCCGLVHSSHAKQDGSSRSHRARKSHPAG